MYSKNYWYLLFNSVKYKRKDLILFNNVKITHISKREAHGELLCPNQLSGISHLRNARLNKGLAFSIEERQSLGLHGLLPAKYRTQDEQVELCKISFARYSENLNRYIYLSELQDRNEKLFFRLLSENIEQMMPIVYTPTVGIACQKLGLVFNKMRGLFITIHDKGHIFEVIKNWPEPDIRCIVVTDGERILGLGDLGACGMGIPVGKLALYTALAGIPPHQCLPITLDVGTNNEDFLDDPLYIGLREHRTTGELYDEFIDEFMQAVVKRYGQNTLIQFEDFGNHNAFRLIKKYKRVYCTFNDDIQGTASVVVAGLLVCRRITKKKKISDDKILFLGAGEASLGIAMLTVRAMVEEGVTVEEARNKIWMIDVDGLLTKHRKDVMSNPYKVQFAKEHIDTKNIMDILKEIRPAVLIGASASAGAFTPEIIKFMAEINEIPIIFALSNPTAKAECTAEAAYQYTEGRCIFASGSPFPDVIINGKKYKTGQGNNAYIFPGIALGVIATGIYTIQEEVFLISAKELANMVTEEDLSTRTIYPPLSKIKEVSMKIATAIFKYAYKTGAATIFPEPKDIKQHIINQMYDYTYSSVVPASWTWPISKLKRPLKKFHETLRVDQNKIIY